MKKIILTVLMSVLVFGSLQFETKAATENDSINYALTRHTVTAEAGCTSADIQALLDLNAEGEYDLTVQIPEGTYEMTSSLYVYPNTTIQADKSANLIKQSSYGAMVESKITDDDGGYDANYNITIDGGIWDSTPVMSTEDETETFRFIHSNNIVVKNAVLCNVSEGSHLIVLAGVQKATIENCSFYGCENWQKTTVPSEAVQLTVVHSEKEVATTQAELITWDDLPCEDISISDCEFYNLSRGVGSSIAVAGKLHTNITIDSNSFHDLSDAAIRLYNYADTEVSDNTIDGVRAGIIAYTYLKTAEAGTYLQPISGVVDALPKDYNITISNNEIKNVSDTTNTWGDGIHIIGKTGTDGRVLAGVEITDNTISNVSRNGIYATAASEIVITGNKISGYSKNAKDGAAISLYLAGGTDIVSHSKVNTNTIAGSGKGTGKHAIKISSSDYTTVSGNKITNADGTGVYVYKSRNCQIGVEVEDYNKIITPVERGIYLSTTCDGTKIEYNEISGAKKQGIAAVSSKQLKINGNTVSAGTDGIYIGTNCTSCIISDNDITKAGSNGIHVAKSSGLTKITDNTITTAAAYGIKVTNSKLVSIAGNTIEAYSTKTKDAAGIYLYKSGGKDANNYSKIGRNTITGKKKSTGKHGIRISTSGYTSLYGNKITNADGTGIYVSKSKYCKIGIGTSNYNTIKNASEIGIYVTTSCDGTKVQYNRISGTKKEGIKVYSSKKVTINRNTISAGTDGILLTTNCPSAKITNNTISSAGACGIRVSKNCKGIVINSNTIKKYSTSSKNASGIYIYQAGGTSSKKYSSISKNKITGTGKSTKKYGIRISDSRYTKVENNTLNKIAGTAIYVHKTKNCIVNKNTIKTPKKMAIYFTTNCDNGKITSNTIKKAGSTAIAVYKAPKTKITSNTITAVKKQKGIVINSSRDSIIKYNTISGTTEKLALTITKSKDCETYKNTIKE